MLLPADSVTGAQNNDQQNKQDQHEGCRCIVSADYTRHANSSFMKLFRGAEAGVSRALTLSSAYTYIMKKEERGLDIYPECTILGKCGAGRSAKAALVIAV